TGLACNALVTPLIQSISPGGIATVDLAIESNKAAKIQSVSSLMSGAWLVNPASLSGTSISMRGTTTYVGLQNIQFQMTDVSTGSEMAICSVAFEVQQTSNNCACFLAQSYQTFYTEARGNGDLIDSRWNMYHCGVGGTQKKVAMISH